MRGISIEEPQIRVDTVIWISAVLNQLDLTLVSITINSIGDVASVLWEEV